MPPRPSPERTGVLVARVWFEHPSRAGMRARVIFTTDVDSGRGAEQVTAAATAEEVVRLVREWIEQCVQEVMAA